MSDIDQLYEAYVRDWHAGLVPDSDALLARAPEADRPALARMIETFLLVAPSVEPTPERAESLRSDPGFLRALRIADAPAPSWGARLRVARENAGLSLSDLGSRFAASFGLGGREARAASMLGELEGDGLDATGVSARAAERLAELLGVAADALRPPPRPAPLFRADDEAVDALADILAGATAAMQSPADEGDELDELLRGG